MENTITADRGEQSAAEVIISADSHVTEPEDLWATRLPRAFRDRTPDIKPTASSRTKPSMKGLDGHEGGRDPLAREREMTADGVSAEVLYPTLGLRHFGLVDAALQEACFRVYNDWLVEYCSASPRLIGLGCISLYDVDHAIAELARAKAAALKGVLVWQTPPAGLPFSAAHYERFWAAAADLTMPVSLHITSGFGRVRAAAADAGIAAKTRESTIDRMCDAANAAFDFIFSGILHRHPDLRVVVVENEIGWLPFMLQQWDTYGVRHAGLLDAPITEPPSSYFRRQMYATFFDDAVGARQLSSWGADNCMWSSDFPHRFSTWPHSREAVARDLHGLAPTDRHNVVCGNVTKLYEIRLPLAADESSAARAAGVGG